MQSSYAVVIDTDSYANDFAQGLYCYTTGLYTPCGLWNEIADHERSTIQSTRWLTRHAVLREDHQGLDNPVSAWANPNAGGALNSVAMFFNTAPPREVLEELMTRAQMYCLDNDIGFQKLRVLEMKSPSLQYAIDHNTANASAVSH